MTVWGADAVTAAAGEGGGGELRVGPQDVVTPLARERAADLGLRIVVTDDPGEEAEQAPAPVLPGPAGGPGSVRLPAPSSGNGTPEGTRTPNRAGAPNRTSAPNSTGATNGTGFVDGAGAPARTPAVVPARRRPARPPFTATAPPPPRPPSPALYRRGAPLHPVARSATGGTRVVVVGAGHVGMVTASRLADADAVDEIVLVDVVDGLAAGVALDITHTASLSGFRTRVRGTTSIEDAGRADFVVITAGRPRKPGMSRADLVSTNAAIVGDVAERVARTSPAAVIVVVTNPLDEMTQHAWVRSGFPPSRVLGMAGVLDTARFQALAAQAGVGRADRVQAIALGSHGDEMVIPLSQATVDGRPLTELLDAATVDALVDRTRNSGAEVVGLLKTGSAYLAPGSSAARMVLAMLRDSGAVMPAAVLADGSYGIRDVYLGLPARLGRTGVQEVVELALTPAELAALRAAADRIRERLGALASARAGA